MKKFIKRKKIKRLKGPVQPVSAVFPKLAKMLNLDLKTQEWSVMALWENVIDDKFKGKTEAFKIRRLKGGNNHLSVRVNSSAARAELTFYLEKYLDKLNLFRAQTGLKIHAIDLY